MRRPLHCEMQEPTTRIYERTRCIYSWFRRHVERSGWQWTVAMRCSLDWRITVPATGPLQIVADLKLVDGTLRGLVQCVPGKQLQDDGNRGKKHVCSICVARILQLLALNFMQHEPVSGYTFYRSAYPRYNCRQCCHCSFFDLSIHV